MVSLGAIGARGDIFFFSSKISKIVFFILFLVTTVVMEGEGEGVDAKFDTVLFFTT